MHRLNKSRSFEPCLLFHYLLRFSLSVFSLLLSSPVYPTTRSVKLSRPRLCFSLSVSTGATDKELAFMHEEGIRDPSLGISEDKEVNREDTSEK